MSVSGIEGIGGFAPLATPRLDPASDLTSPRGPDGAGGAGGGFGDLVVKGVERLQQTQATSDQLAVKAATGDLQAIHQYTIAASEAQVTTQLTVAMRNKALEAFTEIMRMPV